MRSSFELPFSELAAHFDLQEAHARKLFQRAKEKIQADNTRFSSLAIGEKTQLINSFLAAATTGKMTELEQLLREDIVLWSDGGWEKSRCAQAIAWSCELFEIHFCDWHKKLRMLVISLNLSFKWLIASCFCFNGSTMNWIVLSTLVQIRIR